ncbi:MAG: hypothetical protein WC047_04505 [Kiritimatiellales bacterium]
MKFRELLRLLLWPIVGVCILLSAQAFFAHYTQGQSKLLDYLNGIIDLREERTIGTWFETLLFALVGISFFVVSRHPALPRFGKILLVLMALGFCFLSADEMLSLHEFMGYELEQATGIVKDTALDQRGYSWVLLYAPAAIVVCGFVSRQYFRMTKTSWNRAASICYLLAWLAVELVVLLEMIDGWSILERIDLSIVPCFEESFELVFLMLFYSANLLIAEEADL